jgi:dTDP-4-dehydrorhamnose 3,5-epimerase
MEISKTEIEGLLIIKPDVYKDDRGYFFESYNEKLYKEIGPVFVQHNISRSKKNVLRGLHFQTAECAQGKLCQVVYGTALDIALDIRIGSPTYGKYIPQILSDENFLQLWIPPGFAHGFAALSDEVVFNYKCTEFYSKEHERAIRYDDPALNIEWMVEDPIVSEKDKQAKFLNELDNDFYYDKLVVGKK